MTNVALLLSDWPILTRRLIDESKLPHYRFVFAPAPERKSAMTSGQPSISVVTPCLNAAGVIRQSIESVALTNQASVQHIIVDGGSTDGTREILAEYDHIEVVSGPDNGPYDALNKGFRTATGDVLAWLNADDFYLPYALDTVASIFSQFEDISWLTTTYPMVANAKGEIVGGSNTNGYSAYRAKHPDSERYSRGLHTAMQQESTFWTRKLWETCGSQLDTRYKYAAEFELWLRFWQVSELTATDAPLGCFRWTQEQRSNRFESEYATEIDEVLKQHGGSRAGAMRTLARRTALGVRGFPQAILRYCPFAVQQQIVSFDRQGNQWIANYRCAVPS
jgi:hypothetical protein